MAARQAVFTDLQGEVYGLAIYLTGVPVAAGLIH